jgi:hypothetical protein
MDRLAAARCLLMLCLWQGPLPVCHAHGTLANAAEANRPWLAAHLEAHHASVDPCEQTFFGWHIHFEGPDSEGEPSESPSPSLRLPLVAGTSADGVWGEWCVSAESVDALEVFVVTQTPRCPVLAHCGRLGFFPNDAGSLPLPLRLGVARC